MGRYASFEDVAARFEGTIPPGRETWVQTRIDDVEGILLGLVPSLAVPEDQIESLIPQDRQQRVTTLVCEKVLSLYRNPDGATQWSKTVDVVTESRTFGHARPDPGVVFTSDELQSVRPSRTRGRFSTMTVAPWRLT